MATKLSPDKPWTQAEVDFINNHPHLSYVGWAEVLGRSRDGVRSKVNRMRRGPVHGPRRRCGAPAGEAHPRAKLTEELVRELRQKYAAGGKSMFDIWEECQDTLDVGLSTISSMLMRKTWAHV